MGALTFKLFSDELREWEFIESESVDLTDSFGLNIRLSIKNNVIFLVEPNDKNNPWLTNKTRLFYDGVFNKFKSDRTHWEKTFKEIFEVIYFMDHFNFIKKINLVSIVLAFENVSLETLNILYLLSQNYSYIKLRRVEMYKSYNDFEYMYQLSSLTQPLKIQKSTLNILLNTDVRFEGSILYLNLRQRFLKGNFKVFNIGSVLNSTFSIHNLGSNIQILNSLAEGTNFVCQDIKSSEFPLIISNTEFFRRNDSKVFDQIFKNSNLLKINQNKLNVLNHNLTNSGIQSLNKFQCISFEDLTNFSILYCVNISLKSIANYQKLIALYLLNILYSNFFVKNKVLVNQSSNNLINQNLKNKIFNDYYFLPNNLPFEENETFIDTYGFTKKITKLLHLKENVKTNWQILRRIYLNNDLSMLFYHKRDNALLKFNCKNFLDFKNYTNFQFYSLKSLTSLNFYLKKQTLFIHKFHIISLKLTRKKIYCTKLKTWLDEFYNNNGKDFFSYTSSVLINCSKFAKLNSTNFF